MTEVMTSLEWRHLGVPFAFTKGQLKITLGHNRKLIFKAHNRPRSIYQYSSMAPRLSGKNRKFFKFLLSSNSQRRLRYKENNTKYRSLTRKPRSHVRILIYRTWPIFLELPSSKTVFNCTRQKIMYCDKHLADFRANLNSINWKICPCLHRIMDARGKRSKSAKITR